MRRPEGYEEVAIWILERRTFQKVELVQGFGERSTARICGKQEGQNGQSKIGGEKERRGEKHQKLK